MTAISWTISKRLNAGFGLILVLMLLLGATSFGVVRRLHQSNERITGDAVPGMVFALNLKLKQKERVLLVLEHITAADPAEIARQEARMGELQVETEKIVADFKALPSTSGVELERLAKYDEARIVFNETRKRILDLSRQNKDAEASELFRRELLPDVARIDKAIDAIYDASDADLVDANGAANRLTRFSLDFIAATAGLSLLASVALAFFIARSLNRTLGQVIGTIAGGSREISAASEQVSNASQTLAKGASEQAAAVEETSASLEEVSSMTKRNADSAVSAQSLSSETRAAAETGAVRTNEMQAAVAAIRSAGSEMASAIAEIRASSHDVSKIIKTIDEIAFQTNILALNAAVEAARAGESGAVSPSSRRRFGAWPSGAPRRRAKRRP